MCGIVALHAYAPEAPAVDPAELLCIRDAMEARGPDGAGAWIAADRRTALGHRRLAIIDPSPRADQPMTIPHPRGGGGVRIVFNGEIYNHARLRAELERQGERFETTSDTEVLARLYAREGEAMLPRLRGMFAFCIWDETRGELFCARDPLGIKPLYLADDGHTLRLASQVKALLAGDGIDTTPDPAGHVGFFLLGSVPEPHTAYRGIRALAPGSWLRVDAAGRRHSGRYYDLPDVLRQAVPAGRPLPTPQLAERLRDSLRLHRVSDVRTLLLLSAGRDSATLAALLEELEGRAADTLTIAFDHPSVCDERNEAQALAARWGGHHFEQLVNIDRFIEEREALLAAMDQPTIDGINVYWTARAAREAGYKVALSGLGADELFGGYPSFRQVPALVRWGSRTPAARTLGGLLRRATAPWIGHLTSPKYAGVVEYAGTLGDAWLLRRALFMPWELEPLLGFEMAREGLRELDLRGRLEADSGGLASAHAGMIALEAGWYMRNQLLRDADWAGMAHGVEIRVPFADATLLQELAPWLISAAPPGKAAMAATPRHALPEAILRRPKSGFGAPPGAWLAERDGTPAQRGQRGWARFVHQAMFGDQFSAAPASAR